MRKKQTILDDSESLKSVTPQLETRAYLHERLILEVLIDIRDILEEFRQTHKYFLKIMAAKD